MRKIIISVSVQNRIEELELFLKDELKLSKEAAQRRTDRIDAFLKSLVNEADYPLCRFKKWNSLGFRCAVFEKDWVFAYEVVKEGVIVRDMSHAKLLKE